MAGKKAFGGESGVDVLSAILSDEPPPFPDGDVPPALERVVRRCLRKPPDDRFQSARDLAFQLEAMHAIPGTATAMTPVAEPVRPLWIALAVAGALAASAGTWFLGHRAAVKG